MTTIAITVGAALAVGNVPAAGNNQGKKRDGRQNYNSSTRSLSRFLRVEL